LGTAIFRFGSEKNADIMEPFATGLFVRKQGGKWNAFLLDFEDTYRTPISLREEASGIVVLRGNKTLGFFDEAQQTFKRDSDNRLSRELLSVLSPPETGG
jgi:hypothetical protein